MPDYIIGIISILAGLILIRYTYLNPGLITSSNNIKAYIIGFMCIIMGINMIISFLLDLL